MSELKYNMEKSFKVKHNKCKHRIDITFNDIYQKIEVFTEFNNERADRHIEFEFEPDGSFRIFKLDYRPGDSNIKIFPGNHIHID